MPQCVMCQQCGCILYEGPELKPPEEILIQYDGKCPRCGKKLAMIPQDVDVKPAR